MEDALGLMGVRGGAGQGGTEERTEMILDVVDDDVDEWS